MLTRAAITGWGWYSPEKTLGNQSLEKLVATSDSWIRTRTGIRQRHVAGPTETTSTMGLSAARAALAESELEPRDIDLVICATTTPDQLMPSTACLIQKRLGAEHAGAFDLNAACSGFLYGLIVGNQFIQSGTYRRVLIVAGETLSRFMNWTDRNTCVLFGDGAAAVVLEATTQNTGVLGTVLGSRGDVDGILTIEGGGCAKPATAETISAGDHFVRMRGNEIFKMAVRTMAQASQEALLKARLTLADVHTFIPHQANCRIITAIQQALGMDESKIFINIDRHGNTGSASVGLALAEFACGATPTAKPLRAGDNLLLVAFGGGLTWAAAVLRWANVAALKRERLRRLLAA